MISLPTRTLSITDVPSNIRNTTGLPVTFSTLRYATGGANIQLLGGTPIAIGSLTFVTNPVNTETIAINGVTFTFVTGASTTTNVHIGATKEDTASNLRGVLAVSANGSINVASYARHGGTPNVVNITYLTAGTPGNAYTLANSSGTVAVTRSGATLTGGLSYGSGQAVDAGTDFNDADQSLVRWAVASASGPTSLAVTDYQA